MSTRQTLSTAASALLFAAGAMPVAGATERGAASAPPRKVQISDPAGDANYVNDASTHQGSAGTAPDFGNQAGPVDASSEADILGVWFTHDAKAITVHIRTEAAPSEGTPVAYFVATNPANYGHWGCLLFVLRLNDRAEAKSEVGYMIDQCGAEERIEATHSITGFKDGTGHLSISVPRSGSELLGQGSVISAPVSDARLGFGTPPVTDDTERGTSYKLTPR